MTKITVTANIMVGVLVLTERGTKFSLDISEGGDVIFFPMQIYRFPEVYGPQVSNLCLYYLLVSIYFVYFCHSTVFFFFTWQYFFMSAFGSTCSLYKKILKGIISWSSYLIEIKTVVLNNCVFLGNMCVYNHINIYN